MTYAMPAFLGRPFTRPEWAELNRLRLAARHRERRERARVLAGGVYARLGTDHAALLVRELAHGMTVARMNTARLSQTMQRWCTERGLHQEARECAEHAASDFTEGKQWASRYAALIERAKRTVAAHLCARLAQLLRTVEALAPVTVTVEQPSASRIVALASHLAPQAPPLQPSTAHVAVTARLDTLEGR
jgi:antitoxin (DNA-binding transcriptional repressor) of toxin-antitoxin stability system